MTEHSLGVIYGVLLNEVSSFLCPPSADVCYLWTAEAVDYFYTQLNCNFITGASAQEQARQ